MPSTPKGCKMLREWLPVVIEFLSMSDWIDKSIHVKMSSIWELLFGVMDEGRKRYDVFAFADLDRRRAWNSQYNVLLGRSRTRCNCAQPQRFIDDGIDEWHFRGHHSIGGHGVNIS